VPSLCQFFHRAFVCPGARYRRAMARLPRHSLADGRYFHVYARGVDRTAIFVDREDRLRFMQLLAAASAREAWRCHAFCLMDTHVHLVVEAAIARVSRGMHRLLGLYARHFNDRYARSGHLFGDRFGARLIESERYLSTAVEYVLQNPVRAGLVEAAAEWPWSGPRASRAWERTRTQRGGAEAEESADGAGRLLLRAP
jgi:putative transposase